MRVRCLNPGTVRAKRQGVLIADGDKPCEVPDQLGAELVATGQWEEVKPRTKKATTKKKETNNGD